MRKLIQLQNADPKRAPINACKYKSDSVLPHHILEREEWFEVVKQQAENAISDILKTPTVSRTQTQITTLVEFM